MTKIVIYLNNGDILHFNGVRGVEIGDDTISFYFEKNKSALFYLSSVAGFCKEEEEKC